MGPPTNGELSFVSEVVEDLVDVGKTLARERVVFNHQYSIVAHGIAVSSLPASAPTLSASGGNPRSPRKWGAGRVIATEIEAVTDVEKTRS